MNMRRLALTLAAASLVIAGVLGFALYSGTRGRYARLEQLARAAGSYRIARGRLTGGFRYQRCMPDSVAGRLVHGLLCRQSEPSESLSTARLSTFASDALSSIDTMVGGDRHALAIWDLLSTRREQAVTRLRGLARDEPANARVQNDLAISIMTVAESKDDPSLLMPAFVAADSAVRLDPSLPESWFTLGVTLEALQLPTDALEAWERYLTLDDKSPWATEARERIASLRRSSRNQADNGDDLRRAIASGDSALLHSLVRQRAYAARAIVHAALRAWGTSWLAGNTHAADSALALARAIAPPLHDVTSDAMPGDAIAVIDRARALGDRQRTFMLARGHAALGDGSAAFDSLNRDRARDYLTDAFLWLGRGRSPMVGWASYYLGTSEIAQQPAAALRTFVELRRSTPREYVTLRSFAARSEGYIHDIGSDYVHAIAAYDSALAEGSRTHEPEITLRTASWLAALTSLLRGREAGWRALYSALAVTGEYPEQSYGVQAVRSLAALSTSASAPRLSVRYADEVIRNTSPSAGPAPLAVAYTRSAGQLIELGELGAARVAVDSAYALARRVRDERTRTMLISDATLARGTLTLRTSPESAATALEAVVDEYRASNYGRELPKAYVLLARALIAARRFPDASSAFDSAMAVMDRQRAALDDPYERTQFIDNARNVIDQIVAFRADRGDTVAAFTFFDRTRARVLLERLTNKQIANSEPPQRWDDFGPAIAHLPKDVVVLSYAVIRNEMLLWKLTTRSIELRRIPIAESDLEDSVAVLGKSMVDPSRTRDFARVSWHLYRLLITPAGELGNGKRLVIIPDRSLNFVPFAALWDSVGGRYLVEKHEVTYTPSATVSSHLGETEPQMPAGARLLALGNPAFDTSAFPLPRLPAAEREAREIASSYRHASVLIGKAASDLALDSLAPRFDILHFAGHAVVRSDVPRLSHLVLAPEGASDGAAFASEIASWNLRRTGLVVLSGCSTSAGGLSATEGVSSLASAFFTAGARTVIASLWTIEDAPTADFFIAFHRRLAQGARPATALRDTQREWIGRGDTRSLSVWAAFQLFSR
jgi:CHAT domain-containing protein